MPDTPTFPESYLASQGIGTRHRERSRIFQKPAPEFVPVIPQYERGDLP